MTAVRSVEPMHTRRPDWLNQRIERRFTTLSGSNFTSYSHEGTDSEYWFYYLSTWRDKKISTTSLITELEALHRRKLRILDIGAGAGAFVARCIQSGHEAQGISAHDYRTIPGFSKITDELPNAAYLLGDANNLDEIVGLYDEFDLITSRYTLMHLADPIATLEQAANRLSPKGILAVSEAMRDSIHPAYLGGTVSETVIKTLKGAGFSGTGPNRIIAAYSLQLVMQASAEAQPVRFPIEYREA